MVWAREVLLGSEEKALFSLWLWCHIPLPHDSCLGGSAEEQDQRKGADGLWCRQGGGSCLFVGLPWGMQNMGSGGGAHSIFWIFWIYPSLLFCWEVGQKVEGTRKISTLLRGQWCEREMTQGPLRWNLYPSGFSSGDKGVHCKKWVWDKWDNPHKVLCTVPYVPLHSKDLKKIIVILLGCWLYVQTQKYLM